MTGAGHRTKERMRPSVATLLPGLCLLGAGWLALPGAGAEITADSIIRPNTSLLYTVEPSANMPVGFAWQLHVASDGMVNLGSHGAIKVVGMTFAEAKAAIDKHIGLTKEQPRHDARPTFGDRLHRIQQLGEKRAEVKTPAPKSPSQEIVQAKANVTRKEATPIPSTAALAYQSAKEVASMPPQLPKETPSTQVTKPAALQASTPTANGKPPQSRMVRLSKGRSAAAIPTETGGSGVEQVVHLAKGRMTQAPLPDAGTFVSPAPHECATVSLPPYIIHPPDILLIESTRSLRDQPISGQHLVRPDGTVGLGIYGSAYVSGLTLEQAKAIIGHEISQRVKDFDLRDLSVDVLAYNSKVYYVITDGGGFGEQVYRLPITGHETVLDALAQINGLPAVASKKNIWVARPCAAAACGHTILPVDWCGIASHGLPETNYQIFPGDRVYVKADKLITIDSKIAKALSPIERLLGVTLLGSTTYNSITGRGFGFNN